ncbi:MAG: superoxide dismutase [Paludibacteraceae bacterium]|nr:superoxide dismutase [Paludibacteraceae bacterium]
MLFTLISLPYAPEALEPVISKETIEYHYGKHLQGYVDNLNKLVAGTEYEGMPLEEIVVKAQGGIFNNAGQILNHNLYFTQFAPVSDLTNEGVNRETGEGVSGLTVMKAIVRDFGSLEAFKAEFEQKGVTLFGSGWVWLAADKDGKLVITQEPNAGNPLTKGLKPLLTMDVWEHAYYIDYRNRRAAHLQALWQIINWKEIERRYVCK